MKYSTDLRVKVINYVKQGNSRKNTCQVFGIHINTLDKWLKMDRQGSLTDRKPRRTFKKIDPALLLKKVIESPNLLLKDFAAFFQTSSAAIRKAFDRFKITRKKDHALQRARRSKTSIIFGRYRKLQIGRLSFYR